MNLLVIAIVNETDIVSKIGRERERRDGVRGGGVLLVLGRGAPLLQLVAKTSLLGVLRLPRTPAVSKHRR